MTDIVQSGLVPLLDEQTGRFPDEFAPPSVAADAVAAHDAAEAAGRAQEAAEAAENNAAGHEREAGQIVEDATATIPGLISEQVTAQIDPKVAATTQAKTDAETARGAAQTARDDALQAKAQAVAAQEAAAGSAGAAATSAGAAAGSAQTATQAKEDAQTALGAVPGAVATEVANQVAPQVTAATQAKDDAETARDKAIQAAADAIGALPEFDAAAGEYDPAGLAAWMLRRRDGQIYGVQIPKGLATACTKTSANAGIANPTPGVTGTPAIDPYRTIAPFFTAEVNGYVSADGTPHVTAFAGDATFSRTGSNGDVWILAPNLFWRFSDDGADSVTISISDVSRPGFEVQPKGKLPNGQRRPYMLYAKYALSVVDGTARSISNQPPANYNISHNSLITQCKNATTGYSGKSLADDWYAKAMFLLKYASKNSQSVFAGCTNHSQQYAPAVAESNVTRVLVTTAQAAQYLIGSAVMLGSNVPPSTDRAAAQLCNVISTAKIIGKEVVGANTALLLNVSVPVSTATSQLLSTAPWWTGGCDGVVGDGSPTSNSSGREPFVLQGIEIGIGLNEILGDVILNNTGSGFKIFTLLDSKKAATSVTADYVDTGKSLFTDASDGWKYPIYSDSAGGLLFGAGSGGSLTTGMCDGSYTNALATTGARTWLSLGNLDYGGIAGLWSVYGNNGLTITRWNLGSRLSANGRGCVEA